MTGATLTVAVVFGGLVTSVVLAPPSAASLAEAVRQATRPLLLPFQWRSLLQAQAHGDTAEAFARAQNVLRLLPNWADGQAVFAYRFALADSDAGVGAADRAQRALMRLQLALAWMQAARPQAGKHEPTLLQMLAFLPELAVRQEPGLLPLLAPEGGPAAIADRYLAEAERLFPSASKREQRTFHAVRLAAGLLTAGDQDSARAVLRLAIERSYEVADAELATEWRARLQEALRWLDGDHSVDLSLVRADPRLAPLLPHFR